MLNIGHGDAILIRTNTQTILFDTANTQKHAEFVRELEKLSVTKIDKLILSHPHSDHIGGAKMIVNPSKKDIEDYPYLEKISVAEIYDNGIAHGSALYKNLLKSIKSKNIPYHSLKAGDTLDFGNGVKFKVLWPTNEFVETIKGKQFDKEDRANNVNNRSIVGKLTYKNFSMMFTGDCEKESEANIVAGNKAEDLKCDVLKSGHHGISTSSTKEFVGAIKPSIVLISAGKKGEDNEWRGAPYLKPLASYLSNGVDKKNIYCTRWNGTITVTTDGKSFSVEPEQNRDWIDEWIAGKKKINADKRKLAKEQELAGKQEDEQS